MDFPNDSLDCKLRQKKHYTTELVNIAIVKTAKGNSTRTAKPSIHFILFNLNNVKTHPSLAKYPRNTTMRKTTHCFLIRFRNADICQALVSAENIGSALDRVFIFAVLRCTSIYNGLSCLVANVIL